MGGRESGSARTHGDLVERNDGLEVDVVPRRHRAATSALHLSLSPSLFLSLAAAGGVAAAAGGEIREAEMTWIAPSVTHAGGA